MTKKHISGNLQAFSLLLLLLNLAHYNCFAQRPEEFAAMNQKAGANSTIASPPGFSHLSLLVLYQPKYTVVTPALFDISKQGFSSGGNLNKAAENKTVPNGKPAGGTAGQYQPLPVAAGNKQYNGNQYQQAPAGNFQQRYVNIPLRPRSNVPLPGSNVPIPAPLKLTDKKSNYDIAPPGVNKTNVPLAGSKVPLPKPLNTGPANLGKNPSIAGSNTSVTKPLSATGNLPNNTSPAAKSSTTTPVNAGYQSLPGKSNVPLPASNVSIPRPMVVSGSQRSDGSFKTASTTTPASGTVNNTGIATSSTAGQKYVSAPPPPGQSAKTTVVHQYDKVRSGGSGYESANNPLSPASKSGYQTLPLKKGGYESAGKPISSGSNSGYQKLPLKSGGYESAGNPLSSVSNSSYQKLPLKSGGYESAGNPLSSVSNSSYQKLPLKSGGYESAGKPISSASGSGYQKLPFKKEGYESATKPLSATGNQTSPLTNRGYDKINQTPPGYNNAPAPVKNYQSVTSPLSSGASTKSTAAQTTLINDYKPKVPVPSNVKPMSRPTTGRYVTVPKTNTATGTSSTKGSTEVKRGALTQGSNTKGALQVSKATQDKIKADKAKEAAKQKSTKQKKIAAFGGKKG